MYFLMDQDFPPVDNADENGLLCIGGNLDPQTLLKAYSMGIFPWFNEDEPPMWWSPDPRLVLYPKEIAVSKSMKQLLKKQVFEFTIDTEFETVIQSCRELRVSDGTWISPEIVEAYVQLFELGHAHSSEVWLDGELVGGLYGVQIGKVFFGESMFSKVSNASKAALIYWSLNCMQNDIRLIDCQQRTDHLMSMGAREIPRSRFIEEVEFLTEL